MIAIPGTPNELIPGISNADLLTTHPLVALRDAIDTLAQRNAALFDPLIVANGPGGRSPFIQKATDALLFALKLDRISAGSVDGLSLHWLTEILGFLWKLTLLEDLGFTADERDTLMKLNRMYQHIKTQVAPGLFAAAR
jgi:hypothetical protein